MDFRTNLFNQAYPQIIGYQGFGQKYYFRHRMSWVFLGVSGFFGPVFGSNGNIPLFFKGRTLPAHHRVRLQRPLVSSHAWGFCHQRDAARLHRPAAATWKKQPCSGGKSTQSVLSFRSFSHEFQPICVHALCPPFSVSYSICCFSRLYIVFDEMIIISLFQPQFF